MNFWVIFLIRLPRNKCTVTLVVLIGLLASVTAHLFLGNLIKKLLVEPYIYIYILFIHDFIFAIQRTKSKKWFF